MAHCLLPGAMNLHLASWKSRILFALTLLCSRSILSRKAAGKAATRYSVDIVYLKPCSAMQGTALKYLNLSQEMSSDGLMSISGVGDLIRPAQQLNELLGVAHKCRDAVSANTCEYFTKYAHSGDACGFINSPLMPWSSFVSTFQPSFKCPIQAVRYLISNASIDVDAIARMFGVSPNNDVWKIVITIKDEKRAPYICLDAAVRIVKYASRG